jgi:autoinducer 2 (AI-2) kinase
MEENAARIPPGANGVYAILSNLMNARRWVHASPAFLGFNLSDPAGTGRAACVRAIEEAAAYVVRGHLGIIGELTSAPVTGLTFSGGAAKGALWPQIIADVTGLPVHVPAVTESSALGAALCAGKGAGLYSSLTDLEGALRKRVATFEPQPAAVAAYDDSYARWLELYPRMLELSEDGLLDPLWRAAGVSPGPPAAAGAGAAAAVRASPAKGGSHAGQ